MLLGSQRTIKHRIFQLYCAASLFSLIVNWRYQKEYEVAPTFDSPAALPHTVANKPRTTTSSPKASNENTPHQHEQRLPPKLSTSNAANDAANDDGGGSGICLMVKDDNNILPEWVAYHYHVFNMRRLFVAVDPYSKTSPSSVLEPFTKSRGNFDLTVTIWNEEDYTPDWFRTEDPSSFIKFTRNKKGDKVVCGGLDISKGFNTTRKIDDEVINVCKFRKRQLMFYNECLLRMQVEHKNSSSSRSWTVLIDSDEFIVPNPWIADYITNNQHQSALEQENFDAVASHYRQDDLRTIFPEKPSAGSLWSLFHRFQEAAALSQRKHLCVMAPRINFGGEEDSDADNSDATLTSASSSTSTTVWNHKNFQTLRFKYHADHKKKVKPKGILNAAKIWGLDKVQWGLASTKPILNVHVPHKSCDGKVWMVDNPRFYEQPLAIHHYIGSLEQFLSRGDVRRNPEVYREKSHGTAFAGGDENIHNKKGGERWWIKGWLDSFVETHGSEKVYSVLGKDYATIGEEATA